MTNKKRSVTIKAAIIAAIAAIVVAILAPWSDAIAKRRLAPDSSGGVSQSQIGKSADLYNDAVQLMHAGKHRQAAEIFEPFLKNLSNSPADRAKAHYNLAVCYQRIGGEEKTNISMLEKARDTFESFLKQNPESAKVADALDNLKKVNVLIIERKSLIRN